MLSALGVPHVAVAPQVEEQGEGAAPETLVLENARRKALAGLELANAHPGDMALGVDTEVVVEGRVLGKAASVGEAREHLQALSGRTHEVLSGVVLIAVREPRDVARAMRRSRSSVSHEADERSGVARSLVTFIQLTDATLDRYLQSGEWRDKAGAHAIQGLGSTLVRRLEGDFANVVGLPLQLLLELAPELFPEISSYSG